MATDVSQRFQLSGRRDLVGRLLLLVCAVGALAAAAGSVSTVINAGASTQAVETWRLVGFVVFAGLFMLLFRAPRRLSGLWELVIAAKVALPLAGLTFLHGAAGAGQFVAVDGTLAVMLVAAYVLMRGWRAQR